MIPYEMDEVDKRYRDSIREALSKKDIDKLMQLVSSLSAQAAQSYIDEWTKLDSKTMDKIGHSIDTTAEIERIYEILDGLLLKANLSGTSS